MLVTVNYSSPSCWCIPSFKPEAVSDTLTLCMISLLPSASASRGFPWCQPWPCCQSQAVSLESPLVPGWWELWVRMVETCFQIIIVHPILPSCMYFPLFFEVKCKFNLLPVVRRSFQGCRVKVVDTDVLSLLEQVWVGSPVTEPNTPHFWGN